MKRSNEQQTKKESGADTYTDRSLVKRGGSLQNKEKKEGAIKLYMYK